jgi:hypothetical protein
MPQAIVAAVVSQVVQSVVSQLVDMVSNMMQKGASQPEMDTAVKQKMNDEGMAEPKQQHDCCREAADESRNQGKYSEGNVFDTIADTLIDKAIDPLGIFG